MRVKGMKTQKFDMLRVFDMKFVYTTILTGFFSSSSSSKSENESESDD